MEFKVSFVHKGESLYEVDRKPIGLDLVEKLRKEVGEEIALDKFKNYIGR